MFLVFRINLPYFTVSFTIKRIILSCSIKYVCSVCLIQKKNMGKKNLWKCTQKLIFKTWQACHVNRQTWPIFLNIFQQYSIQYVGLYCKCIVHRKHNIYYIISTLSSKTVLSRVGIILSYLYSQICHTRLFLLSNFSYQLYNIWKSYEDNSLTLRRNINIFIKTLKLSSEKSFFLEIG